MATDELDAPLGQGESAGARRRRRLPVGILHLVAGGLGLVVATFAGWALVVTDPLGGEPMIVTAAVPKAELPAVLSAQRLPGKPDATAAKPAPAAPAGASNTVTIIDGSTGKRQDVPIVSPLGNGRVPAEQGLLEATRHGAIPKIGPGGRRPADAYARLAKAGQHRPDGPRVAIVVTGLGVSANATQSALAKLPDAVTFAFAPYGAEIDRLAARARAAGHEVLLQVPMEPFDYPDNDPGPQTLLVSLPAEQNLDRLHWLMSRFQGYVGIANLMGARFTATEPALTPVLHEAAKRGLIYLDDGSSRRSLAGQIAGAGNLPFARAEVAIDAVPAPANIDRALTRLEALARERGIAVGVASALPVAIERIAQWAKAAEARGITLVPITAAVAAKPRSS